MKYTYCSAKENEIQLAIAVKSLQYAWKVASWLDLSQVEIFISAVKDYSSLFLVRYAHDFVYVGLHSASWRSGYYSHISILGQHSYMYNQVSLKMAAWGITGLRNRVIWPVTSWDNCIKLSVYRHLHVVNDLMPLNF